jgi:enoyl-CoA hydratase/carnithine racemase
MSSTVSMVRIERKQALAVVTLASPDYNRLNRAMLVELQSALQQLQEPGVRAVLLNAESPVFS